MAGPSGIEPSTCEFGAQQDQPERTHKFGGGRYTYQVSVISLDPHKLGTSGGT